MTTFVSQRDRSFRCTAEEVPQSERWRAVLLVGPPPNSGDVGAELWSGRAEALEAVLPEDWRVVPAVYQGEPTIATALESIEEAAVEDVVVLFGWPHFSRHTTGPVLHELYRMLGHARTPLNVAVRVAWHDDAAFINAQAALVADLAAQYGLSPADTHLSFWAHHPRTGHRDGSDPYEMQVRCSAALVAERLGWPLDHVSLRFLETNPHSRRLAFRKRGSGALLACPITFSADTTDILSAVAMSSDPMLAVPRDAVYVCESLDRQDAFIRVLRDIALRGSRPVPHVDHGETPLLRAARDPEPEKCPTCGLFMMGVSLTDDTTDPEAFASVKKPRMVRRRFLERLRERADVMEAFVWDTCQRVELYAWLVEGVSPDDGDRAVSEIRRQLFGDRPPGLVPRVRRGVDAVQHLARVTCGLDSHLPGDMDVAEQLQTSCRIAQCVGAAGPRSRRLVRDAVEIAEAARDATAWGRFGIGYCAAALSSILGDTSEAVVRGRHIVIGGSTTSRSILHALSQRFRVPQDQLTVVYRDHHGQMKLLRKAVGSGTRLRVHSYSEPAVTKAIADADFVLFGIDHAEPVIDLETLSELRDYRTRPLTLVDFNSFGSVAGSLGPCEGLTVVSALELDRAVAAHAAVTITAPGFAEALQEVEAWIQQRVKANAPQRGVPAGT